MIMLSHLSTYDRGTFALLGPFVETSLARTIDAGTQSWRLVSLCRDADDDLVTVTLRSAPDTSHIVRFQLTTFDFPLERGVTECAR